MIGTVVTPGYGGNVKKTLELWPMDKTTVTTTSQGLKIILRESHFSPVVTIQTFVNVGSADENPKTYGAAHLFEHLIFKGTKKRGVGAIASEVEAAGGDINAYTSFDQTVFYLTMASRYADRGLDILSDAMINHHIPLQELEREREVVIEEIKRGKDSPGRVSSECLFKTSYKSHPYGRPVIGFEKTVRSMPLKDIKKFYNTYYSAKNMTLVVVGDFETKAMLKKIEKKFRFKNKGSVRKPPRKEEKPPQAPRFDFRTMDVQETYLNISFLIPNVSHPDVPALDILAHLLGGDETSWLFHACMLEDPVANSIHAQAYTPRDNGLMLVGGTFPHEKVNEAMERIAKTLTRAITQLPLESELQTLKENMLSERVYEKETVEGQARLLGFYDFYFNDLTVEEKYYARVQSLTPEDILEVAQKYLKPNRFSISVLSAKDFPFAQLKKDLIPLINTALNQNTSKKTTVQINSASAPEIKTHSHTKGKTTHIFQSLNHIPVVSLRFIQMGGLRTEPVAFNGIAQLLSQVWTKGSKTHESQYILTRLKSLGATLRAFSGKNTLGLGLDTPTRHLNESLELFEEILCEPRFDEKEFEREKTLQIEEIRTQNDSPAQIASQLFMKTLFPSHPYGRPSAGTLATVEPLSLSSLVNYYETVVHPDTAVFSAVGSFDSTKLDDALKRMGQRLPSRKASTRTSIAAESMPREKRVVIHERADTNQAHILSGYPGVLLNDPERHTLSVMSAVLSGQGGRLFLDLRDTKSLAYSVHSMHAEGIEAGYFATYIGCAPEKIKIAIEGIYHHMNRLCSQAVTRSELDRAHAYLIGQKAIEFQYHSTRSMALGLDHIYGNGYQSPQDYEESIRGVTTEKILNLAQKLLRPERETLTVVCPPQFAHLAKST